MTPEAQRWMGFQKRNGMKSLYEQLKEADEDIQDTEPEVWEDEERQDET